ncbi:MAG: class I SAM-dependent methyltransferase [Alphaproteobacteria bacterium]|jgi:SAM-dependent methyltransferase|nr:class I SAM-dependent methyltransferase [Alphaproteobacteria bacterium]|tara:strand:+ start:313 stop:918 length:606 start_codon:yes stop_codon:yes gene_type:complete
MSDRFAEIGAYYDKLVAQYGHDPRACDYGRHESQQAKFKVMAEVVPLAGKRLLDVGCGFADFADYLKQHHPTAAYDGVDISQAMVTTAQDRHKDCNIRHLNILEDDPGEYDVVTANGIFYLLGEDAPEVMRRLISRMFHAAREAVAFNSLSARAVDPQPDEFYADPLETVAFCYTLTPWVVLRHDYHDRDFTCYLYKSRTT